jgi:hypothetical protein
MTGRGVRGVRRRRRHSTTRRRWPASAATRLPTCPHNSRSQLERRDGPCSRGVIFQGGDTVPSSSKAWGVDPPFPSPIIFITSTATISFRYSNGTTCRRTTTTHRTWRKAAGEAFGGVFVATPIWRLSRGHVRVVAILFSTLTPTIAVSFL